MGSKRLIAGCTALFLMWPVFAHADRLPDQQLATGKPDETLCGANVYSTPMKDVVARLGAATETRVLPDEGVVEYRWHWGPLEIVMAAYSDKDPKGLESAPHSIEVKGEDPQHVCRTGRGLGLGDRLGDVKRRYGRYAAYRNQRSPQQPPDQVDVQWDDETLLELQLSPKGRVISIHLMANVS